MKGDLCCLNGRLMRHDPQDDDPEMLTDLRQCPDCEGDGCDDGDGGGHQGEPVAKFGRSDLWKGA
jgi:hypothetical protein